MSLSPLGCDFVTSLISKMSTILSPVSYGNYQTAFHSIISNGLQGRTFALKEGGGGGEGRGMLFGIAGVLHLNLGYEVLVLGFQEVTLYSNIQGTLPMIFSQINSDSIFLGLKFLTFHFHTFRS